MVSYGRFLIIIASTKPTIAIATITATPMPSTYMSVCGTGCCGCWVDVDAGALAVKKASSFDP